MMSLKNSNLACPFWLFITTCVYYTIAFRVTDKKDLTITSESGTDVTQRYFVRGRGECFPTLNFSDPEVKGQSVERPDSLRTTPFDIAENDKVRQGARFQWRSPLQGSSRKGLKGFYLQINWKVYPRVCRLYILQPSEDILNFSFETKALRDVTRSYDEYEVKVYSLPADPRNQHNRIAFRQMSFMLKEPYDVHTEYPGNWKPIIRYEALWDQDICNGSVDVYFEYPPQREDWKLKYFDVMLLKKTSSKYILYRDETIVKDRNSNGTNDAHVRLDGLPDGFYQIKVRVKNHERSPPFTKECICRKAAYICDTACGSSKTRWFDFGDYRSVDPPEVIPPARGCHDANGTTTQRIETSTYAPNQMPGTEMPQGTTTNTGKDITIYVAAAAGVVIVFIIGFLGTLYLWRRKQGTGLLKNRPNLWQKTNGAPLDLDKYLRRKLVYVLAVTDQPESVLLVKSFCSFLTAHCHCSVIDPRDADLSQICESAWVTSMIQRCDCIMFINSKDAAKLVDNFLSNVQIDRDPDHSLAYKALQIAFNADLSCRFNIVTFTEDWTKDRLAVLSPRKYVLPNQLSHFTHGLHNLSESQTEKLANHLPFTPGQMENDSKWKNLLRAVKKVKISEKKDADFISSSACTASDSDKKPIITKVSSPPESDSEDIKVDKESVCSDYSDIHTGQIGMDSNLHKVQGVNNGAKTQLPGSHADATMDWRSFVTVGVVSDIHPKEAQENDKFLHHDDTKTSKSQHAEHAKGFLPNKSEQSVYNVIDKLLLEEKSNDRGHNVSPTVIAPKDIESMGLVREDSTSNKQVQVDDDAGYETLSYCEMENEAESDRSSAQLPKDSNGIPIIIKPPNKSLPTDNISSRLRALNEEVSDECFFSQEATCCKLQNATGNDFDEIHV